ncbi:hypothetical protein BT96DRAFT_1007691 [Gymnopus androsaceus JB14]|uniref:Uncharacterized protein n=1 Tax=Gymnopus androsaceus JB14 TaxID=1447944 RepID=A0A6A4GH77_9AGAR|nr:hypothetical protein BT96DRAFT_1007691 [Gymnopus androsaceus JB14]
MAASNVTSTSINSDISPEQFFEILQPTFITLIFVILLYGESRPILSTVIMIYNTQNTSGIYTVLFGLYTYLQIQQQARICYYQVSLLLLYLLATASLVIAILAKNQYDLYEYIAQFTGDFDGLVANAHFTSFENLIVATVAIYVAAIIIADCLLLYRCYIVWGSSKLVIAGPVFITVVNAVTAFIAAILGKKGSGRLLSSTGITENSTIEDAGTLEFIFLCVNLLTNLMLTGLIAGRIWWISHATNRFLSSSSNDKRINGIVAMVLESGLLYPVTLIICIILLDIAHSEVQTQSLLTMVVGIASTLIMVRADLGISIENASNGTNGTDYPSDLEMNKYIRFEDTPESEVYGCGNGGFGTSELGAGSEIEPLSSNYLEVSRAAFNAKKQSSSRLNSTGPSSGPGEVSGLIVLSPPKKS